MTWPQLRAIGQDPQKLQEQYKRRMMTPEVRAKADHYKRKYGRF